MEAIIKITFYASLLLGSLLLIVAAGSQVYRKESPISFLFVGFALLALPLALVMYNDHSGVDKNEVIRALRNNGFLSSPVPTNFSELGTERALYKAGEAYVKYEKGFEKEAQKVKTLLQNISGMGSIKTKEVKSFRTGEIQIGLF